MPAPSAINQSISRDDSPSTNLLEFTGINHSVRYFQSTILKNPGYSNIPGTTSEMLQWVRSLDRCLSVHESFEVKKLKIRAGLFVLGALNPFATSTTFSVSIYPPFVTRALRVNRSDDGICDINCIRKDGTPVSIVLYVLALKDGRILTIGYLRMHAELLLFLLRVSIRHWIAAKAMV